MPIGEESEWDIEEQAGQCERREHEPSAYYREAEVKRDLWKERAYRPLADVHRGCDDRDFSERF